MVGGFEAMDNSVKRHYIKAYGDYVPGEHYIGNMIAIPGTKGTVLWSYREFGDGKLTYVVRTAGDRIPVRVLASDVLSR